MEYRNGLVVSTVVSHADGFGERKVGLAMLGAPPNTRALRNVRAEIAYDTVDFIAACRKRNVTPHVACDDTRHGVSAVDGCTIRHIGYRLRQIVRKRFEDHFGWGKTVGRLRQALFRGFSRVDRRLKRAMAASNLMRIVGLRVTLPLGAAA